MRLARTRKRKNGAAAPSGRGVVGVQRWRMVVLMSHARPAGLPRVTSIPLRQNGRSTMQIVGPGARQVNAGALSDLDRVAIHRPARPMDSSEAVALTGYFPRPRIVKWPWPPAVTAANSSSPALPY